MKVIYDLGANSGLNIPYYLLKADKIVAVEANPALARTIISRFQSEITAGRVCVENCALVNSLNQTHEISFYVHKRMDVWSTVKTPSAKQLHEFKQLQVPCKNVVDLIRAHGDPFYVKVDIEGLDAQILTDLLNAGIVPPYISAEVHNIDVFCALVQLGRYNSFKLVDGQTVPVKYRRRHVHALDRSQVSYSFPCDSAGPFGNDVDGVWLNRESFFELLAFSGLGWKDIHASAIDPPDPDFVVSAVEHLDNLAPMSDILSYVLMSPFRFFWKKYNSLQRRLGLWMHGLQ